MDEALVINPKTGGSRIMTADAFARTFPKKETRAKLILVAPVSGDPVNFRAGWVSDAKKRTVAVGAHFARAAGFGNKGHIFGGRLRDSFNQALDEGKQVLMNIHQRLIHRPLDFTDMKMRTGSSLVEYVLQNHGNYVTAPVRSAKDAFDVIKTVRSHHLTTNINERLHVAHRGGVVSFPQFFLDARSRDLQRRHDNLRNGTHGDCYSDERIIGFPSMFRLIPTQTTLDGQGYPNIKGNHDNNPEKGASALVYVQQLAFEDELYRESEDYGVLWDQIENSKGGVYVLACQSVTLPNEDVKAQKRKPTWAHTRWIIKDIAAQTYQSPRLAAMLRESEEENAAPAP